MISSRPTSWEKLCKFRNERRRNKAAISKSDTTQRDNLITAGQYELANTLSIGINKSKDILDKLYAQLDRLQQQLIQQSQQQLTEHQYFVVTAQILSSKRYSGYRRIMFQEAQNFNACYDIRNPEQSIWYPEETNDLYVSLMFASETDARHFIAQMANSKVSEQFRGGMTFQRELTVINVQNKNDCRFVLITDYDPSASSSPANSLDNTIHTSEITSNNDEPEKGLRSVEDLRKLKVKESVYKCHIASQAHYPEFARDPNNLLFVSYLFHGYFDGDGKRPKVTDGPSWGIPPELAIKFIEDGPTHIFDRQPWSMIIAHVVFRDSEVARGMDGHWRNGSEIVDEFVVRTYFYTRDAEATIKYLRVKYYETDKRWRHCNCEEVDCHEPWEESKG